MVMSYSYRRWFYGTMLGIACMVILLVGLAWFVDPIEIWETPVIRGFNHIKPKQEVFLDVFKPFQVRRHAPEIVYIGTSRVYVGFRPEENAYNMGGSSLSLPDMQTYLRFIYSQHAPKKVFVGLDLFQFSHEYMGKRAEQKRLNALQKGNIAFLSEAWEVSLGTVDYLKETIGNSYKNRDKEKEWERGWDVKRGVRTDVDVQMYYGNLHDYYKTYTNFVYDSDAIVCLRDILLDAKEYGVEVILFFNPVAVDLLALQSICGRAEVFRQIKAKVAELHPVYDFAWASSLAIDRAGAWLDGSHFHYPTGDRMREIMTGNVDDEICRVLTVDTVDRYLQEEAKQYEKWGAANSDYIRALAEVAPQKIPEGALKLYIGF